MIFHIFDAHTHTHTHTHTYTAHAHASTPFSNHTTEWLKLEDVKEQLYINKRRLIVLIEDGRGLGQAQPWHTKFLAGVLLLALLIFVIWFPLLLISALTSNGQPNPPSQVCVCVCVCVCV